MHRLREHERKKEDIYEDLPLFVIERDYGSTEAGKTLASQGCKIMFFFADDFAASFAMQP
jgi:hypothetical protein